ncbi:5,6-dimethylbenzimidazole synthase [Ferroplasma acidiphilum]|uniref:5,6-dimethylbenzimidazole synthase n=1 Tax=Ferroplasma acidiphilum TaxID=74969 RepID=A0A7K4FQ34_9ARCH|nr:5,6-dimethylbenzimidazole synthase [Ferroplasma acidiphilum]NOL61144.1 5,6-dimethylbenzimidazole synthase [Ferroplasma acidiphilum]WMT52373.1 MAG: 5,6-dimethylbenzimidazole synthase [Ferroplasma acidiphilum]
MDVYEAIKKRRDVRSWFSDKHIDNSTLGRILKAGNYAPSVGLSQPWNYILIRDIETRKKIKAVVEEKRMDFYDLLPDEKKIKFRNIKIEGILESDLNMAVTCDVSRKGPDILGRATMPEMSEYSVVLSIENMWLAARAEGIGMGWISFIDPDRVKKILGIPESIKLVGYLAVGYLSEDHDIPELEEKKWEKRLDVSNFVYMDKWGEKPDPETRDKLEKLWI